jgi:hypothetical protein
VDNEHACKVEDGETCEPGIEDGENKCHVVIDSRLCQLVD